MISNMKPRVQVAYYKLGINKPADDHNKVIWPRQYKIRADHQKHGKYIPTP